MHAKQTTSWALKCLVEQLACSHVLGLAMQNLDMLT